MRDRKRIGSGGSAACRRRYFKYEARGRLRDGGAGLYITSFFVLAAVAGVRSVCGKLPDIFGFSFSSGGEIPAAAITLLGDIIITVLIYPVWFGLLLGGKQLLDGDNCRVSDCFVCFNSLREYRSSLRWQGELILHGFVCIAVVSSILRATRIILPFCGDYKLLAAFALYSAAIIIVIAGLQGLTCGAIAPVIIANNRMMTPAMAFKCSRRVMVGYKNETLLLVVSFVPHIVVSVASGGTLFILTAPYIAVTFAGYCDYIYSMHAFMIESGEYLKKYSHNKRKLWVGNIFTERI